MKSDLVKTTRGSTLWIPGEPPRWLELVRADSLDLTAKRLTISGMIGTPGAYSVYSLPMNGYDIELRHQVRGMLNNYENSERLGYLRRCRIRRRYTSELATYSDDVLMEVFAELEFDEAELYLER